MSKRRLRFAWLGDGAVGIRDVALEEGRPVHASEGKMKRRIDVFSPPSSPIFPSPSSSILSFTRQTEA